MLKVMIPGIELYDESKEEFIITKERTLTLEHSLVSLSKWESKWKKPFLTKEKKSVDETIDYIRCMTVTQNVEDNTYLGVNEEILNKVRTYIEDEMTATTFSDRQGKGGRREVVTSELIYYWMVALKIPFECQKWHLNRLLTLINVCNLKNNPSKKMKRNEVLQRNASLNAARRKAMNSKG